MCQNINQQIFSVDTTILIWFHWFKLEPHQVLTVLPNRSNKLKSPIFKFFKFHFSSDAEKILMHQIQQKRESIVLNHDWVLG